jgi:aspartate/methionine/tyrosine aminotransferase
MTREKYSQLLALLSESDILLFSDEVYRGLEYSENDRLPAACDVYPNAVSLGVMSKTYGLAGLRIGWAASANQKIIKKMASLKDYTTICNSAPSEFLATVALKHSDVLRGRSLQIIAKNLAILDNFFRKHNNRFSWVKPLAGPIAFPSIKWDGDVDRFCADLVSSQGVLLLPSSCYSFGNKNFRIGFGRENMPLAVEKLEEFLREFSIMNFDC